MTTKQPAQDGLKRLFLKEKLLTVAEFAEALNVSKATITRWIARREIHYFKIGPPSVDAMQRDRRCVRIPSSEVDRLTECVHRIY